MQGEQRDEVPTPRQRAFQTALFVMLTMMLLDPPADPSRRGVGEADAAGGLGRREKVAAAAVDEALRSAGSSGARGEALRNVSGLYRGTYASTANGTAPASGAAVVSLDMLKVEGVREVFVVRGLFSLASEGRKHVLTSAYGVYVPSARSVSLLANVGAPRADLSLRYNGTSTNGTAPEETTEARTVGPRPPANEEMAALDALDERLFTEWEEWGRLDPTALP